MSNIGLPEILLILGVVLIFGIVFRLIPFWRIFRKAGFPPALSLLILLPLVDVAMMYYIAFAEWPSLKKDQK